MSSGKIFVALSSFAEYGAKPLELLRKSGLPYTINPSARRLTAEEILQFGQDCHGIVAGVEPYTSEVLSGLANLKCISRCGVGIDNVDQVKARELGIQVLNTPDAVVVPVAELTIAMMLDLLRHITWHTITIRERKWQKKGGQNLTGKKVGIIGLGRIGKKVIELLKNFGTEIMASDPHPDREWAKANGVALVSLAELLKNSDIVTLHLSSEKNSPFQLGEEELQTMKKGAILLNLSRGELVDEDGLYTNLKNGHLGGAGLDVFSQEPYVGKLCGLENVIMTPHVATLTRESRLEMEIQAVENILSALAE